MATSIMTRVGASQNVVHGVGWGGSEKVAVTSIDWTVAQAAGTVLQGPPIQAGSVVTGIKVISSGLGTATFSVGTSGNAAQFMTGQTASPATSPARPYTMTKTEPILVTTAGASTAATGSVDLIVYFMPLNN